MKLDAKLLGDIFREEGRAILVVTTRQVRDADLALDIVGEAFAVAFEQRSTFRGSTRSEAVAWVYSIARNTMTDHFRRGGAELRALERLGVERSVMGEDERHRVEELAGDELSASVARELDRLPDDQQTAVRLRVVDELSYEDVARRLDVTPQVARARVSRGLRSLGRSLQMRKETRDVS